MKTRIPSLSGFTRGFLYNGEKSSDANSELFKEDDDEAVYKNLCRI